MARKKKDDGTEHPVDPNARLHVSPEDQAKAKKWFVRARELGNKRQFDYAIEYYVNGLEFWPEAVEEACKPLHGCAVARRQSGGKKPGLKDTMKRSMTDKNAKTAYVNSLWLFSRDPESYNYLEGVTKSAVRLRADDAAVWAAGVCLKALESAPKPIPKQFETLSTLLEEVGDRAAGRGEAAFGVEVYRMGVAALNVWRNRLSRSDALEQRVKTLSTKLTILRGQYQTSESYRDSISDTEGQADLHDQQRSMQADDRIDELIAKAEREFTTDPDPTGRSLKNLVGLLCRRESNAEETRAIGLLLAEHKKSDDYRWKQMADDIRMKQLGRAVRAAVRQGDPEAVKTAQIEQLRFELAVFKERTETYPTDQRIRFELAVRNFRAGRFDDAIPLFQAARSDPKNRSACGTYLGRCFVRKGYNSQAVTTLKGTIAEYPHADDELGKTMRYWLGRAQEAAGEVDDAQLTYGDLLQVDYTYRDVRDRLDSLSSRS